jgi:hypothetical protein
LRWKAKDMTRLLTVHQIATTSGVKAAAIRAWLLRSNLRRGRFLSASPAMVPGRLFAFGGGEQLHAGKDYANAPLE